MSNCVLGAVLVPGLPHVLARKTALGWRELAIAMRAVGEDIRSMGAETVVVVSTQWMSVLGLQVQTRSRLVGTRVDENWHPYDFGTLSYDLRTDVPLAESWLARLVNAGFQARATDHEHFPIDSGLISAMRLLDPDGELSIAQVSLNLYGTTESVASLGSAAAAAAEELDRKVVFVGISMLSGQPLRTWIEPEHDQISVPLHDEWNRRIVSLLEDGRIDDVVALQPDFGRQASADARFRVFSFLTGGGGVAGNARIRAYAPIWGMGAAVVSWL